MHPNQISNWKKHLWFRRVTEEQILEDGKTVFQSNGKHELQTTQESELYEQIGRLNMELEWLKKNLPISVDDKCSLIEPDHPILSIRRQCELIELNLHITINQQKRRH